MMDFNGYPAYQESYPAQKVYRAADNIFGETPEHHALNYEIDENTMVHVIASGNYTPFQEILDTIEVTETPKPTKYAPYISQ